MNRLFKSLSSVVQVVRLLRDAYDRVKALLKKVFPLAFICLQFFLENEKYAIQGYGHSYFWIIFAHSYRFTLWIMKTQNRSYMRMVGLDSLVQPLQLWHRLEGIQVPEYNLYRSMAWLVFGIYLFGGNFDTPLVIMDIHGWTWRIVGLANFCFSDLFSMRRHYMRWPMHFQSMRHLVPKK